MSLEFAQGKQTSQTDNEIYTVGNKVNSTPDLKGTVDIPISHFRDIKGVPFSATLFDYSSDYNYVENHPALAKVDPTFQQINAIDEYIVYQIRLRGYADTQSAYEEILNEIEESIGISKHTDKKIRLAKLGKYTILKLKGEKQKARYKIIEKQYGTKSSKSERNNRFSLT